MKNALIFLFLLSLLFSCSNSFETYISNPDTGITGSGIVEATSGEYIVAGRGWIDSEEKPLHPISTVFLMKKTAAGEYISHAYFRNFKIKKLVQLKNGDFAVTGFVHSYRERLYEGDRTQGIYVLCVGPDLKQKWEKLLRTDYNSTPRSMIPTADGGLIIVGDKEIYTQPDSSVENESNPYRRWINEYTQPSRSYRPRVIKLDRDGNLLWEQTFDNHELYYEQDVYDVCEMKDGSIALAMTMNIRITEHRTAITFLDPDGKYRQTIDLEEQTDDFNDPNHYGYQIEAHPDGGLVVAGNYDDYKIEEEFRLMYVDADLKKKWSLLLKGDKMELPSMCVLKNGNIIVVGEDDYKEEKNGKEKSITDLKIHAVSPQGKIVWERSFFKNDHPQLGDVHATEDGGFIVVGTISPTDREKWTDKADVVIGRRHGNAFLLKLNGIGE